MEILSKTDDKTPGTAILPKNEDLRVVTQIDRRKPSSPRPPSSATSNSLQSSNPHTWSSLYLKQKIPETYPEPSPLLYRTLTASRKKQVGERFLRPSEHILGTFYGVVSLIDGKDWNVINSEYLPIYFVRVSVKNIRYPFRILVIDNDIDRVVDFIVNSNTKTSFKKDVVRWGYKETFEVKFEKNSHAFQFHDTISRMISTLKKSEQFESENSDKILSLEVHLPNSQVNTYQFYKTFKLRAILKFICKKEHLRVNDHYFNYMGLTDDSLDMELKVGDIRTNAIRLVSKTDLRRNSTDILEKVSTSSSKKNGGIFSLFRKRFSRKSKGSRMYRSAPSVLQYTDNIFMVERQPEQKRSEDGQRDYSTLPANSQVQTDVMEAPSTMTVGRVKRRAPQPPKLVMPQQNSVNENQATDQKKIKRRAPSPPKSQEAGTDKKKDLPVFIAPPPPETEPPPLEECETPVGPVDTDLDYDTVSIESPDTYKDSETNSTVETEEKLSSVEENIQDSSETPESETEDENKQNAETENSNETEDVKEEKKEIEKGKEATTKDDIENSNNTSVNGHNENLSNDEFKFREAIKNLSPQQLQALVNSKDNWNQSQQDPTNIQNQQFLAMHQQQQFLSNLLMQQMLQQQMSQQRTSSIVPVAPMPAPFHAQPMLGGVVHPMQPGTVLPMHPQAHWQGVHPGQTVNSGIVPAYNNPPVTTISQTQQNNVPLQEEKPPTEINKPEPTPQNETKESNESTSTGIPLENEELVNRPLFKKMLAQVSQGKSKDISKDENHKPEGGTSQVAVSPATKIGKVPTSYVESAEKNISQFPTKSEEKKEPVSLGQIGRKSSYVDSAIDRTKVNNVTAVDNSGKIPQVTNVEEKKVAVVVNENGKTSVSEPVGMNQPGTQNRNTRTSVNINETKLASTPVKIEQPEVHAEHSVLKVYETKAAGVYNYSNRGLPLSHQHTALPTTTHKGNLPPVAVKPSQPKSPNAVDKTNSALSSNYEKKIAAVPAVHSEPQSPPILNPASRINVQEKRIPGVSIKPDQYKSPNATDMKYSALSSIYAKKAAVVSANNSLTRSPSVQNTVSPTKDSAKKFPTVSAKPSQVRNNIPDKVDIKSPAISKINDGKGVTFAAQSPAAQNTVHHRKFEIISPPIITKPGYSRQISEPVKISKPNVGPKPTNRPTEKSKTLPKTHKDTQHVSISLTPEERKLVSKFSVVGTSTAATNVKPVPPPSTYSNEKPRI